MNEILSMNRTAYNNILIPDIEEIAKSELYNSMIKFNVDRSTKIVNPSAQLFIPDEIVLQYIGQKTYEDSDIRRYISGLMFWHSNRGLITRMIIIPEASQKLLTSIGYSAKEFIDYFEDKDPIQLQYKDVSNKNKDASYRIDGIISKFRHENTSIKFYANNSFYISMEKILHPEKLNSR